MNGDLPAGPLAEGNPVRDKDLVLDLAVARISDAIGLLNWRVGVWQDLGYASPLPGQHAIPPLGQRSPEAIEGARGAIEVIDGMLRDLRGLRGQLADEIRADQDARDAARCAACVLPASCSEFGRCPLEAAARACRCQAGQCSPVSLTVAAGKGSDDA